MSVRTVISFKGCTRAEAIARMEVWADAEAAAAVRAHAARLLAADEEPAEILSQITQLRGALADQQHEVLAIFVRELDEFLVETSTNGATGK